MGQLVLQPDAAAGVDSFMSAAIPTFKLGTNTNLYCGHSLGNKTRWLIRFNIDSIPDDAIITSAVLALGVTTVTDNANACTIRRVAKNWVEADVTWNSYDSTNNWDSAGGDFIASPVDSFSAPLIENIGSFAISVINTLTAAHEAGDEFDIGCRYDIEDGGTTDEVWISDSSDGTTPTTRPQLTVQFLVPNKFTASGETNTDPSSPTLSRIRRFTASSSVLATATADLGEAPKSFLELEMTVAAPMFDVKTGAVLEMNAAVLSIDVEAGLVADASAAQLVYNFEI